MGPGEENSGRLVTRIRTKAMEIAKNNLSEYVINDGPPGIGCATIAALSGTDQVLLVIEPTKSGLHDAQRLIELIDQFNITTSVIINKYDINMTVAKEIEHYLQSKNIPLLAKIPFDKEVIEAMIEGKTIIEYNSTSAISEQMKEVWNKIKN
jgi:MinD superfamily P-loop ATPase